MLTDVQERPAVPTLCTDSPPTCSSLNTLQCLGFVYQAEAVLASTPFTCSVCGPTLTTQKRRGPDGPGTLCNKCGLQHLRGMRRRERDEARERDAKKRVLQRMSVASLIDGVDGVEETRALRRARHEVFLRLEGTRGFTD